MKIIISLISLIVVAIANDCPRPLYPQEKVLEYKYHGIAMMSIPGLSEDESSLIIESDVLLQQEKHNVFILKLRNPEILHSFNDFTQREKMNDEVFAKVEPHLLKPMRFLMTPNEIRDIEALPTDRSWSVKIKYAIIRLFETTCHKRLEVNAIKESPLGRNRIEGVFNNNILTRSISMVDERLSRIEQTADIFTEFQIIDQKFYIVKKADLYGNIDWHPSKLHSDTKATTALIQSLMFQKLGGAIPILNTEHMMPIEDLLERDNEVHEISQESRKQRVVKLIESIEEQRSMTLSYAINEDMSELQREFRKLTSESMLELLQSLKDEQLRIFSAQLPFQIEKVISIVSEIISQDLLPQKNIEQFLRRASWSVKEGNYAIEKLMEAAKLEMSEGMKEQIQLTIGALLSDVCQVKEYEKCPKTKVLKYFEDEIEKLKPETRGFQTILRSIGNGGLSNEYFRAKCKDVALNLDSKHQRLDRIEGIRAMRKWKADEDFVEDVLELIFWDRSEDTELRIESFNVLMELTKKTKIIEKLAMNLEGENNMQVGNYMYSYIKRIAEVKGPMLSNEFFQQKLARTLLTKLRRFEDGLYYSKNREIKMRSPINKLKYFLQTEVINVPEQFLPRKFLLKVIQHFSDHSLEFVEFSVRTEGLEKDLERIIKDEFEEQRLYNPKIVPHTRKVTEEDIQNLKFSLLILGNEVGIWQYDEKDIEKFIKDVSKFLNNETPSSNIDYFETLPIIENERKFDSLIGFPMTFEMISNAAIHFKKIQDEEKSDAKSQYKISNEIVHRTQWRLAIDLPNAVSGVTATARFKLNLPVSVRFVNDDKRNALTLTLENNDELEILDIDVQPSIFHQERILSRTSYRIVVDKLEEVVPEQMRASSKKEHFLLPELMGDALKVTHFCPIYRRAFQGPKFPLAAKHRYTLTAVKQNSPIEITLSISKLNENKDKYEVLVLRNNIEMGVALTSEFVDKNHLKLRLQLEFGPLNFNYLSIDLAKITPNERFLHAGENLPSEYHFKIYNKDLTIIGKVVLDKSKTQKEWELKEQSMEDSPCAKCDREKGLNIYCVQCKLRRRIFTQMKTTIFTNEKNLRGDLAVMLLQLRHFLKRISSDMENSRSLITEKQLFDENKDLDLPEGMKLYPFQITSVINHQYSSMNLNLEIPEWQLSEEFNDIPTLPYYMRPNMQMRNFVDYGETLSERLLRPGYGACYIDHDDMVKTLDGVVYKLNTNKKCIQRFVELEDFPIYISTRSSANGNKRDLIIKLNDEVFEIIPIIKNDKYKYTITMDSKPIDDYVDENISITTHTPTPEDDKNPKEVFVNLLKYDVSIQHSGSLISITVPHKYRSTIKGLCGHFDGEILRSKEFMLPDNTLEGSLDKVIREYTEKNEECKLD